MKTDPPERSGLLLESRVFTQITSPMSSAKIWFARFGTQVQPLQPWSSAAAAMSEAGCEFAAHLENRGDRCKNKWLEPEAAQMRMLMDDADHIASH